MKKYLVLTGTLLFFAMPFLDVQAATLYLKPEQATYGIGDTLTIDARLKLDDKEECVNVVEAVVSFDHDYLELVDFGSGDSILTLWLEMPKIADMADNNHQGRIKFSGGIPGGYCGQIPGDSGDSNVLGKLIFKVQPTKQLVGTFPTKVQFLSESKVLLNDGLGTAAKLDLKLADILINNQKTGANEWDKLKNADNIPPEPFIVQVLSSPGAYNDQTYVVWLTTDKQTGIDHYEVQEVAGSDSNSGWWPLLVDLIKPQEEASWQRAEAPYVLKDQRAKKNIRVKAIDKAGNERISEYDQQAAKKSAPMFSRYFAAFVVLLLVVIIFGYLKQRAKKPLA